MSSQNDTTAARYCRICGDVALQADTTPAGEPVLSCADCGHAVALAVVEYATLATPRSARQTLRRRLVDEAFRVAGELNTRQAAHWSPQRSGELEALFAVLEALTEREPAALRRLVAEEAAVC
jgi:hypothetical protein